MLKKICFISALLLSSVVSAQKGTVLDVEAQTTYDTYYKIDDDGSTQFATGPQLISTTDLMPLMKKIEAGSPVPDGMRIATGPRVKGDVDVDMLGVGTVTIIICVNSSFWPCALSPTRTSAIKQ